MKQKLAQIGLIVVIIVALGFVVKQLKPKQYGGYERMMVDVVANKVFITKVKAGEVLEFPTTSPYSEGKNAYPVLKCMKDGTIFAYDEPKPVPTGEGAADLPPVEAVPVCPVCGSNEIGLVEMPEGQKVMDVPGPVQVAKPGKVGNTAPETPPAN
ncbi:MAG: hypothetical protein JW957_06640 [Candidatus Omnitrophica bacterium]|nr:hypothetical protein [Candidatus Omnitrophota bacterium]